MPYNSPVSFVKSLCNRRGTVQPCTVAEQRVIFTNGPDETLTDQVVQDANDVRWQVEELHRGLKQLTGTEKSQYRHLL